MKLKLLAAVAIVLLIPCLASAGWVIFDKEYNDDTGEQERIYIQEGKVMYGHPTKGLRMVFDVKNNKMIFINPKLKKYWKGTPQEFQDGQAGAMKTAMEKALKEVPAEQRAQYKAMMQAMQKKNQAMLAEKANTKISVSIKKDGQGEKIAGYATEKYKVYQDGKLVAKLWVAPKVQVDDEIDPKDFMKMTAALSPEVDYSTSPEMADLQKKGYPLKMMEFEDGDSEISTNTEKVEKKNIPAKYFAVPKGYQKVTLGEIGFE